MVIFCPYHKELGQMVEADHVATYDDETNPIGTVEMNRFRCRVDSSHTWEHPSKNFWLRWSAWGAEWKRRRDNYRQGLETFRGN